MSAVLIELLPDLVFLMHRDGTVVAHAGGQAVPDFRREGMDAGDKVEQIWSPTTAALIKRLLRRSIAGRAPVETRFQEHGHSYELRISPQGPNRAIGVIRPVLSESNRESDVAADEPRWLGLDRRGFLRRLNDSLATSVLREMPIACAVVHLEGISEIARTLGVPVSEEVMSVVMARVNDRLGAAETNYSGQLRENELAVVLNTADHDAVEASLQELSLDLRAPIPSGEVEFRLMPHIGVALSAVDASSAEGLLEHARTAVGEARRAATTRPSFYSEAMQMRSLSRLDLGRELRDAIANRDIRFRYVGRHDLVTGAQVATVAYLNWHHPLRGDIAPAEFLRIAVATGLAVELSRMALDALVDEFAEQSRHYSQDVKVSFGPLRDHIFHEQFVVDVERVLARNVLPAERLELRIAEKAFVAREVHALRALQKRGVQIVVDEAARAVASLPSLASAPISGLQLDRSWTTALLRDETARKVCRATMGIAHALGLAPMAAGVDTQELRDALVEMGCRYGSGDVFAAI
ncbi:EAL domain-containing protein [Peristeroidobacter agariperforans]|uniref:EAL domain-containing protein n=1 Tax=Peristeroidobacter agariperforans TaxID=268404 RepID=UPI00101C8B8E|nr:EAL domain-containing protein [Peristeroidobacter agariperforans]